MSTKLIRTPVRATIFAAIICCVSQAEAQITIADLNLQTQKTIAAQQAYTLAVDEFNNLTAQIQGAFNRWQLSRSRGIWYYSMTPPNYVAGDYWTWQAVADQIEYDRLTALVPVKKAEVDSKKQAYLREYARLNAMFDAYDRQ